MALISRVGQAALGVPFILLGYDAATEPGGRSALAADLGLPAAETLVRVNGAAMVAGGVALVTGVLPRLAAAGLVASLIPTTIAGHAFWKSDDHANRKAQRIQVLKNIGLAGALVTIAARGRKR